MMSGFFSIYQPVLQGLGYAVFHSLWQGAVLFFPLQVLLFFCTKSSIRYKILFTAFSLLFIAFIVTFWIEWQNAVAVQQYILKDRNQVSDPILEPNPLNDLAYSLPWWQRLVNFHHSPTFRKVLPAISISYAFGILLLGIRMVLMIVNVRKIRTGVSAAPDKLQQLFSKLKALLPVKESVQLFLSERVKVPMMLGYFKPVVILPVALINQLDWQQTEAILLHELAHVKRKDYLFNILQSIMEVFMFFNPLVWWLSGIIRKEREHACDDIAVSHTQYPVKYAEALLQLEYARNGNMAPALAATGGGKKYTLLTRIKRIVEMKTTTPKSTQSIFASATIVMIIAAVICFYAATAQDKEQKDPVVKTQTKSYTKTKTNVIVTDDDGKIHTYSSANENDEIPPDVEALVKNAMTEADSTLANVDWEELSTTVSQALQDVDWEEIGQSIKEAGEKIDWEEINKSINEARKAAKDIDWDKISKEISNSARSIKSIDNDELKKALEDLKDALEKADGKSGFHKNDIDNDELKESLEDFKRALEEMGEKAGKSSFNYIKQREMLDKDALKAAKKMYRQSIEEMKVKREEAMATAKKMREDARDRSLAQREVGKQMALKMRDEANKQRTEAMNMRKETLKIQDANKVKIQSLLDNLEKDGLIDRSKKFDISYKDDKLDVNGKNVSIAPYKTYFNGSKDSETVISGDKNSLSVTQKQ